MAEPQPADVHEGDDTHSVPANAEDRKTAAALSSLDRRGDDDETSGSKKEGVDSEALGKAMKNLDSKDTGKGKQEEVVKKAVKVDQADVGLLASASLNGLARIIWDSEGVCLLRWQLTLDAPLQVEQLDLTKAKATDC
ncbi:hypothetical protein B0A49_02828 [Cryomyces minteri]|uniref:Uncharacterized protein n=1 Tax=Cryomyces minteri TaxID=331657 RepID=A0A4U0XK36_9PEZI|nr:hypothetical protein B0A49_02828 [Cryomyces minteri]